MTLLAVLLGGAIGAPSRWFVDQLVRSRHDTDFPWGTFVINVSGSLLLGLITGLVLYHGLGDVPRVALGTGFCGAYTTFSTYSYETVELLERGDVGRGVANALGSMAVGLAAAGVGLALMAAW